MVAEVYMQMSLFVHIMYLFVSALEQKEILIPPVCIVCLVLGGLYLEEN